MIRPKPKPPTLRYPDRARALALLEGDAPSLSEEATRWLADLEEQVFAAAEADMSTLAETVFRAVAGDAGWEGLTEPAKQMFTANGPAIVAELRGGFPESPTTPLLRGSGGSSAGLVISDPL